MNPFVNGFMEKSALMGIPNSALLAGLTGLGVGGLGGYYLGGRGNKKEEEELVDTSKLDMPGMEMQGLYDQSALSDLMNYYNAYSAPMDYYSGGGDYQYPNMNYYGY